MPLPGPCHKRDGLLRVLTAKKHRLAWRSEAGFTLLELITVMVVVAIVTGVVSVSVDSVNEDTRLSNAATRALADVRHAQEMAMTHRREVDVVVNAASDSYTIRWHDTAVPLDNPIDGGSLTVRFGSGDYHGVDMTAGLSSLLTFTATGEPLIGGSRFSGGVALMQFNSKVYITIYSSGLSTLEKTVGGGGCAAAC